MSERTKLKSVIAWRTCEHCQKEFAQRNSGPGRFCSRTCHYNFRREKHLRENGVNCLQCGSVFTRSPARVRGGFCSMKCFGLSKEKPENYVCPECGGKKAYGAKKCNSCWGRSNLKGEERPCANCGAMVYKSPARWALTRRAQGVFCNHGCHSAYMRGEKNPAYVDGRQPSTYARGFKAAKREVLERDGASCFLCGSTEKPDVHHINRDRQCNELANLVTLCRQCHAKQHVPPLLAITERARSLSLKLAERFNYPIRFST